MEETISKGIYQMKVRSIEEQISSLNGLLTPLKEQLGSTVSSEVTFEQIKNVLQNFQKLFSNHLQGAEKTLVTFAHSSNYN